MFEVQVLSKLYSQIMPDADLNLVGDWTRIYRSEERWRCMDYIKRNGDGNFMRIHEDSFLSVVQRQPLYFLNGVSISSDISNIDKLDIEETYSVWKLDFILAHVGVDIKWERVCGNILNSWGVKKEISSRVRVDPSCLYCSYIPNKSVEFFYLDNSPISPQSAANIIIKTKERYQFS